MSNRAILYYDDIDGLQMLVRCLEQYHETRNYQRSGVKSIVIYANDTYTASFRKNISGSTTGKSWLTPPLNQTKDEREQENNMRRIHNEQR